MLSDAGMLVINSLGLNPFSVLPDADALNSHGLKVIQDNGRLLSGFDTTCSGSRGGRLIPSTRARSTVFLRRRDLQRLTVTSMACSSRSAFSAVRACRAKH